jgi:ferredoxin
MPRITVEPDSVVFEGEDGESIMRAATRNGYWWPTTCGGRAQCTVCATVVDTGAENLSPLNESEIALMPMIPAAALHPEWTVRLACQARLTGGDVTITKRGVRPRRPL